MVMPESVIFHYQNKPYTIHFGSPRAALPIQVRYGEIRLVQWGMRENENSEMPLGGWARQCNIRNEKSRWNIYLPRPVKICIDKFMEKDFEGKSCWYEITKGKVIEGLLARSESL